MANSNLSRRSFGLGLIAHGITACDKVENYAISTKFAEKNVPIKGQVLDIDGFNMHGYIEGDGTYWYNILMQDLGWRKDIDGDWSSVGSDYTRVKRGYLYINLKKRVAVYFYPLENFNAFRVTLNPKSEN